MTAEHLARRDLVRAGWDRVADAYVTHLADELDRKPADRALLARFAAAAAAAAPGLPVLDVGCGPGHVAAHVAAHGVAVHGIDLSPQMVARARARHPGLTFEVRDVLDLPPGPGRWSGALAFYSLINLDRAEVPAALERIVAGLVPGAPALVAVHAGQGEVRAEEVLGERVPMVATLFGPDELAGLVAGAGLTVDEVVARPPYPEEHPTPRLYVSAHLERAEPAGIWAAR